jgi:serine/threonine protein kinase
MNYARNKIINTESLLEWFYNVPYPLLFKNTIIVITGPMAIQNIYDYPILPSVCLPVSFFDRK